MKSYEKWSIWVADLEPVIGSEQGKKRPVLVISETNLNELLPVVNVLPITSRKPNRRVYPNEALLQPDSGLINESIVLCYQIRTLDKSRLTRHLGNIVENNTKQEIFEALKFQLGIE